MINFNRLQSRSVANNSTGMNSGLSSKTNGSNLNQSQRQTLEKNNSPSPGSTSKFDLSNYQYGSNTKVLVNHNGSSVNFEKGTLGKGLANKIQSQQKGHSYKLRSLEIQRQAAKGQWQKDNIEERVSRFSSRMYKRDFDLGELDRDLNKKQFQNSNNINNNQENKNEK
jgi:hypothetical protein